MNYSHLSKTPKGKFLDQNLIELHPNLHDVKYKCDKYSQVPDEKNSINKYNLNKIRGKINDIDSEEISEKEDTNLKKRLRSPSIDSNKESKRKRIIKNRKGSTGKKKLFTKSIDKNNKLSIENTKTKFTNVSETLDTALTDQERPFQKKFHDMDDFMLNLTKKFQNVNEIEFDQGKEEKQEITSNPFTGSLVSKIQEKSGSEFSNSSSEKKVNVKSEYEEIKINDLKKNEKISYISQILTDNERKDNLYLVPKSKYSDDEINIIDSENIKKTSKGIYQKKRESFHDVLMDKQSDQIFSKQTDSGFNIYIVKTVKIKLVDKKKINKKIEEKLIPEIIDLSISNANEIKLDLNNIPDNLESEFKSKFINDEKDPGPMGNPCEILDAINDENINNDIEIKNIPIQTEEKFSIFIDENIIPISNIEKFTIKIPANFCVSDINIFMYIRSSLVIFIFVFVFYNYLKKNFQIDKGDLKINLGVPTLLFFLIICVYLAYINTEYYKLSQIIKVLKSLIKLEGKVISKEDLYRCLSEELKMEKNELIKSKFYSKIVDELNLDKEIEEFINVKNDDVLSWRKRAYPNA